jgi:hypothetical protein
LGPRTDIILQDGLDKTEHIQFKYTRYTQFLLKTVSLQSRFRDLALFLSLIFFSSNPSSFFLSLQISDSLFFRNQLNLWLGLSKGLDSLNISHLSQSVLAKLAKFADLAILLLLVLDKFSLNFFDLLFDKTLRFKKSKLVTMLFSVSFFKICFLSLSDFILTIPSSGLYGASFLRETNWFKSLSSANKSCSSVRPYEFFGTLVY